MTDRSGPQFEIDVAKFFREHLRNIERVPKAGRLDEGDLVTRLQSGLFVVEAKARRSKTNQLTLGSFMAEAIVEAEHYAAARSIQEPIIPTVFLKRPGKPIGECFAIIRLCDFVQL
jgi:Holliday junction resolvase